MSRLMQSMTATILPAMLLAVLLAGGPIRAENEGQEDLDRATEVQLGAKTLDDLSEIIRFCDSALRKGLDEGNAAFAKSMLSSTLVQRGTIRGQLAARLPRTNPKVSEHRKAALEDLEKAVTLDPRQAQALLLIAEMNRRGEGNVKRAREALEQLIALDLDDPRLRAKGLVLRATLEKDPAKRMADLEEAIRIAPREAAAWRTRGLIRASQGELEPALADFDEAIRLAPKHVPTYELKAVALAKLKKYDDALVVLDKAHELNPKSVHLLIQKARIHAAQKNLDAVLIDLNLAFSIDANSIDVLLLRAGVQEELGNLEDALADVDKVLKLVPEHPGAVRLRAMFLARADKLDEAIAELQKLRELDPKNVLTLMQLGMLYNAAKKPAQAIEVYSAILAEQPDHWMALRSRADALLNSGKQTEAIADYEKSLKQKPKDPGILNNLAWALATSPDEKLRDGQRAIKLATEACEVTDYKQAHILSTLGAACAETGDFDTAIKWLEKGLEVDTEEHREQLDKELESYRGGKPWRELLKDGEPVESND